MKVEAVNGARAGAVVGRPSGRDDEATPPVVYLRGTYDDETVHEIERLLRRSFGPFFFRQDLILDLDAVTSVGGDFVDFIAALVRRLHSERHELLLTRPVGPVRRSLASVGVPNLVPVYESVDEARSVLAQASGPLIPPHFDSRAAPARDGAMVDPTGSAQLARRTPVSDSTP